MRTMMDYNWRETEAVSVQDILGLTLTSIEKNDSPSMLTFRTSCNKTYIMYHKQDCCEYVSVEDICGELQDLIGSPITLAEELVHSNICFFQFDNHKEAEDTIKESLENKAHNDCEGSYNCGNDEYTQEYQLIDSDAVYLGKIEVEYNRHDKTYYYVDEVEYSFSEVKPE